MGFSIQEILAFIGALGIIVSLHEFGHFAAARMCGMRADVFALGMGMRLFGWNKITGFTFGKLADDWDGGGHTDYRLCLLPIGGYVKIVGMIDESMDSEQLKTAPQPYEFRSKNALQKAFVISAGVIMNFLLAISVFFAVAVFNGKEIHPITSIGYVEKNSVAEKTGFQSGDKITSIGESRITSWENLIEELTIKDVGADRTVTIERGGRTERLTTNGRLFLDALTQKKGLGMFPVGSKIIVVAVEANMPAGKAGVQTGDTLLSANAVPVIGAEQFITLITENQGKPLELVWKHGTEEKRATMSPTYDEGVKRWRVGLGHAMIFDGPAVQKSYTFGESLAIGWNETVHQVGMFFGIIGKIFSGVVSFKETIGGPLQIMQIAGQVAQRGFWDFIELVAKLSVSIAVLNILPIPALDGGHLVFIIIEAVLRREVSVKAKMAFQQIGMFLLLGLMAFVLYNDVMKRFFH
ncbi:MAG: RIP metalloprotease RseP [Candidatus Kapaibacterium sp.]